MVPVEVKRSAGSGNPKDVAAPMFFSTNWQALTWPVMVGAGDGTEVNFIVGIGAGVEVEVEVEVIVTLGCDGCVFVGDGGGLLIFPLQPN